MASYHIQERLIGRYKGNSSGPLVVVIGAMHGNEPAGVRALETVFDMLAHEPSVNPGFSFSGQLIGIVGNLRACRAGQRFFEKDLNRQWTLDTINRIKHLRPDELEGEDIEIAELNQTLLQLVVENQPEVLVLLDLHTTSAEGGIFCIPTDDKASLRLAKDLHAPVILGLLDGIEGTLLQYGIENHFNVNGFPQKTIGVAFEAGQHEDPLSVSRSISAVINCLRACGCIREEDVDNRHELILREYSAQLPKVTHLQHVHHIRPGDDFKMRAGYINFQPIRLGEHLADDITGPITAPEAGLILMPLYQSKGSDGFFIVQEHV